MNPAIYYYRPEDGVFMKKIKVKFRLSVYFLVYHSS